MERLEHRPGRAHQNHRLYLQSTVHFAVQRARARRWGCGEFIGADNGLDLALLHRHLAATYGLGEDINLRNWLQATRKSMIGWNGIPDKYLPIFQKALDEAEQSAVEAGYHPH
ncbi:MAG: hypothetical protein PVG14_05935 [Anaerolineales bacterium]